MQKKVLLVTPSLKLRKEIGSVLTDDYRVIHKRNLSGARRELNRDFPDVVLVSLNLGPDSGLDIIPEDFELVMCPFVIINDAGGERGVVDAMKAGAIDVVSRRECSSSDLPRVIGRALREWEHVIGRREAESQIGLLTRHIMSLQEKERADIAREIHDDLGSSLSVLKLMVQKAENTLEYRPGAETDPVPDFLSDGMVQLRKCTEYIDEIAESARSLSHRLSPTAYRNLGITSAIERLAERIETHSDMDIVVKIEELDHYLKDNWNIHLYRIVQEALNNIRKHSGATKIFITAKQGSRGLVFSIADNGRGFQGPTEAGLGILLMEQRCQILGGKFELRRRKEGGTEIRMVLPAAQQDRKGEKKPALVKRSGKAGMVAKKRR